MNYIILAIMLATLAIVIIGVIKMAMGKKVDKKQQTKLMMTRVILQTIAIILLVIMYYFYPKA